MKAFDDLGEPQDAADLAGRLARLGPAGEGQFRIGLGNHQGKVVLSFGVALTHLTITPDDAEKIADVLKSQAVLARESR